MEDSSDFIKCYGARHTQPHSFILRYRLRYTDEVKYLRLVEDDNNENFEVQQQELASPLIKQISITQFVGASHGLVCLFGYYNGCKKGMLAIWNPSIRKSFGIVVVPKYDYNVFGFEVRPDTSDPTVVRIIQTDNKPCHVEVFTLSSGVWNVIPSSNLLPPSVILNPSTRVIIDKFIYWDAYNTTFPCKYMVVSFDLITKEFKLLRLPNSLTYKQCVPVYVCKLRESLVVYGSIFVKGLESCGVWVMQNDSSFKKLFSIEAPPFKGILGFRESGEPIIETSTKFSFSSTLDVYDPSSQQIDSLGI